MYGKYWDRYYLNTYGKRREKALWDVSAALAAARDLPAMLNFFSPTLPLLDLGCGTGEQSAYLAKTFDRVIGVDVAPEAIRLAQEAAHSEQHNLHFEVLDVTDHPTAKLIASREGDMNVYMRGLLHQIREKDLKNFHASLKNMMGETGRLYCVEVRDDIRAYFHDSVGEFSELPANMRQVFISNLPPRGLSMKNLNSYFPEDQYNILDAGEEVLCTNIKFKNGQPIEIPAIFAAIEISSGRNY